MDAIDQKSGEIVDLCQKHGVRKLVLFGSAARGGDTHDIDDIDFLVEFQVMPPSQHADCFFGLLKDLEQLLGMPIDLVEREPISNPFFLEAIERHQVLVYEAA